MTRTVRRTERPERLQWRVLDVEKGQREAAPAYLCAAK